MPTLNEQKAIEAVINNQKDELKKLFDQDNVNINTQDRDGCTLLYISIYLQKHEITKFLLQRGAHLRINNDDGHSPLALALSIGAIVSSELLIDAAIKRAFATETYQKLAPVRQAHLERDIVETYDVRLRFLEISIDILNKYLHKEITSKQNAIQECKAGFESLMAQFTEEDYALSAARRMLTHATEDFDEQKAQEIRQEFENRVNHIAQNYALPEDPPFWQTESIVEKLAQLDEIAKTFQAEQNKLMTNFDETQSEQLQFMQEQLKKEAEISRQIRQIVNAANYSTQQTYPLHIAKESLVCLLQAGFPPDRPDFIGNTLLHYAVKTVNSENVILLTDWQWHAQMERPNQDGMTAVDLALTYPRIEQILSVRLREYLALDAIKTGNYKILKTQLEEGVAVDTYDRYGNTLLHWAVRINHLSLVQLLIKYGAKPLPLNQFGQDPFEFAKQEVSQEITALLKPHPLRDEAFKAIAKTDYPRLQQYIAAGLPIESTDDEGCTLLYKAVEIESIALVNLLLAKGALCTTRNEKGISPLQLAKNKSSKGSPLIYQRLVSRMNVYCLLDAIKTDNIIGVEESLKNHPIFLDMAYEDGNTLVHLCVKYGHYDLMENLLSKGAPYLEENNNHGTAFEIAFETGQTRFLERLESKWQEDIQQAIRDYKLADTSNKKKSATKKLTFLLDRQAKIARSPLFANYNWKSFKALMIEDIIFKRKSLLELLHIMHSENQIEQISFAFQPAATDKKFLTYFIDWLNCHQCHVREIDFSHTGLTDDHVNTLKIILRKKIVTAYFDGNFLTDKGVKELINFINQDRCTLKVLSLNGNNHISWEAYRDLNEALQRRQEQEANRSLSPALVPALSSIEGSLVSGSEDSEGEVSNPDSSNARTTNSIAMSPFPAKLFAVLADLRSYDKSASNDQEDATSDIIRDYLSEILGKDNVTILDPANPGVHSVFGEQSQEGVFSLANMLIGYESHNRQTAEITRSEGKIDARQGVTKPIILVLPTESVALQPGNNIPSVANAGHWVVTVILPSNYHPAHAELLNNPHPLIFFIDSLDLTKQIPDPLLSLFLNGGVQPFVAQDGQSYEFVYEPLCSNAFVVNNAPGRQQRVASRDCGWWAIYNALMIVATGNNEFLQTIGEDIDGSLAARLRALLPCEVIPVQENNSDSNQVVQTVPILAIEAVYDEWCTIAGRLAGRPLNKPVKHGFDYRVVVMNYFLLLLLDKAKNLIDNYAGQASKMPHALTELCEHFEKLIEEPWVAKHRLYENTMVSAFYSVLRFTQAATVEEALIRSQLNNQELQASLRPSKVSELFQEVFIKWMHALRAMVSLLDDTDDFSEISEDSYEIKFLENLLIPAWGRNPRIAIDNFCKGERKLLKPYQGNLKISLDRSDIVKIGTEILPSTMQNQLSHMVCAPERLKYRLKGLFGAFPKDSIFLMRNYNNYTDYTNQASYILKKILIKLMHLFHEPLLLLNLKSIKILAEKLVYRVADFIALCGDLMYIEPLFVDAILNWIIYGDSRESINLETRLGRQVSSAVLLKACGLKFTNNKAEIIKLNLTLPEQRSTQAEQWGCRLGTAIEASYLNQTPLSETGSARNLQLFTVNHRGNKDLNLRETALISLLNEDNMTIVEEETQREDVTSSAEGLRQ